MENRMGPKTEPCGIPCELSANKEDQNLEFHRGGPKCSKTDQLCWGHVEDTWVLVYSEI